MDEVCINDIFADYIARRGHESYGWMGLQNYVMAVVALMLLLSQIKRHGSDWWHAVWFAFYAAHILIFSCFVLVLGCLAGPIMLAEYRMSQVLTF